MKYGAHPLADPGGAHPAPPPPNGRGPMIFLCLNANFIYFSSLASLAINFKHTFNRNTAAKTRFKITFTSTFNIFNDFLLPPPPQVKSWIRQCTSACS